MIEKLKLIHNNQEKENIVSLHPSIIDVLFEHRRYVKNIFLKIKNLNLVDEISRSTMLSWYLLRKYHASTDSSYHFPSFHKIIFQSLTRKLPGPGPTAPNRDSRRWAPSRGRVMVSRCPIRNA